MAQPILAPFYEQFAKCLLRFSGGFSFQWYPFKRLATSVVLDCDSGKILAVARPKPADFMLAVVQYLDVFILTVAMRFVTFHDVTLSQKV
jgi:hypothetical protein